MSSYISEHEYFVEIREIAEWLSDNRPSELGGKGVVAEYGEGCDVSDALWERLDGHMWVIYNQQALEVVAISPNKDAIFEQLGPDAAWGDGTMFDNRRAYWAMYQDVIDEGGFDERFDIEELQESLDTLEMAAL